MKIEINTIINALILISVWLIYFNQPKEIETKIHPAIETIKQKKHEINNYKLGDTANDAIRDSMRSIYNPF